MDGYVCNPPCFPPFIPAYCKGQLARYKLYAVFSGIQQLQTDSSLHCSVFYINVRFHTSQIYPVSVLYVSGVTSMG